MNPILFAAVLDTLTFTAPALMPYPGTCDSLSIVPEGDSLRVVLERLATGAYDWVPVDTLSGLEHGKQYGLVVDLAGCAPCGFRVWVYDAAGNQSCEPSRPVNLPRSADPVGVGGGLVFQAPRVTPSPVRSLASISFALAERGEVMLELLDLQGRRVRVLAQGDMDAGQHLALFDAREVRSGLYFVRLTAGKRVAITRAVVLR